MNDTYEIVNMHDNITCVAESAEAAILAVIVAGEGRYGLRRGETRLFSVLLLASPDETEKEMKAALGYGLGTLSVKLTEHRAAVAACLESYQVVSAEKRAAYERELLAAPDPRAFARKWLDAQQGSMSNVCATAWALATSVRSLA